MSRHEKSILVLLFLFLMSPFLTCIFAIPFKTDVTDLSNSSLEVQTWNSEFRDWYCISDPPLYPAPPTRNNDTSWMARIAIDSYDFLHVVWSDDSNSVVWGTDSEILYSSFNSTTWSTPIAISAGTGNWNNGLSDQPAIAIDSQDNIHVVWRDRTINPLWGGGAGDSEIFYSNYTTSSGWSDPICISDNISLWNTADSGVPFIAIDSQDDLHVTWHDLTSGWWWSGPGDSEIFYIKRTSGVWGNSIPISDDLTLWNNGASDFASCVTDKNDNVHVVWQDTTINPLWGNDQEILYTNFTLGVGWGPIIGLSGININIWNNKESQFPIIATDPNTGTLHVVWQDHTSGKWGLDWEIFYSNSTNGAIWSNATALSGIGVNSWNNGDSYGPWITIDNLSRTHVVWHDDTDSPSEWGTDREILYSNSTNGAIWLNATCLSDQPDYSYMPNIGTSWESEEPCIAYDSTNFVHVVWWDDANGPWSLPAMDTDIFYTSNYRNVGTPILRPISPNPSSTGFFLLNWTADSATAYFKVYRSTSNITLSGLGGLSPIATTRSNTYTDYRGTNGTYYYVIVAHNVGGDSPLSNCKSVVVAKGTIPFPWWVWLIVSLIIILVIALYFYYRKNKKKKA